MRVHPALRSHRANSSTTPCRLLGKPGAACMCVLLWPHYYLLILLSLGRHLMQTKGICRKTSPGELWKLHFNRTQFTLPGNNWRLVVSSRELNSPSTLSIPIGSCDIYVLFSSHPFGARHVPVCLIVCNHPAHHGGFWGLQVAAHCLVWSPSPSGSLHLHLHLAQGCWGCLGAGDGAERQEDFRACVGSIRDLVKVTSCLPMGKRGLVTAPRMAERMNQGMMALIVKRKEGSTLHCSCFQWWQAAGSALQLLGW